MSLAERAFIIVAGVIGTVAIAAVIGAIGWLAWYQGPGSDAERIKQTEELLDAARRYPIGRFPRDETVPGYLWDISDACWAFLQTRVAANAEQPKISIGRKSPDARWHWVNVGFADNSWIEFSYYQGLLSLCEIGTQ
jgi:hypothetical protein